MKKIGIISILLTATAISIVSCSKVRRNPGRVYMPDMAYSRAYETYSSTEGLQERGVSFNAMPVKGTIARGDMLYSYPYQNDSAGYAQSAAAKNPLSPDSINMVEAERLYLVNCAICHGAKLNGNGPLYNDGKGPYPNAPRNLTDDYSKKLADGTMYHAIVYGKGAMGSYASQLNVNQRWMVIDYIRKQQGGGATADSMSAKTPTGDTAMKAQPAMGTK